MYDATIAHLDGYTLTQKHADSIVTVERDGEVYRVFSNGLKLNRETAMAFLIAAYRFQKR